MDTNVQETTVAFAVWNDRIAPMFDVARQAQVVHVKSGQVVAMKVISIETQQPIQKVLRLIEAGVETLVCGDISRQVHAIVEAYGIHVFSSITGNCRDVLEAFLLGGLEGKEYAMPAKVRQRRKSSSVADYHRHSKKVVGEKH
jgi:predicted Fe-Mo cluster-binding NifX family protein